MSENYSRRQKNTKSSSKKTAVQPTKHIKTGFSALQKTLALVGSILSIIVATITITNYLHGQSNAKDKDSSSSTTVIIKEKDSNSNAGTANQNTDISASSEEATASADDTIASSTVTEDNITGIAPASDASSDISAVSDIPATDDTVSTNTGTAQ